MPGSYRIFRENLVLYVFGHSPNANVTVMADRAFRSRRRWIRYRRGQRSEDLVG